MFDLNLKVAQFLGLFTGNRYKRVNGVLYVKHKRGRWLSLKAHMKRQKKLRDNK